MNILLVEDDQESRLILSEFLGELGHQVVECQDGMEALKIMYSSGYQPGYFQLILSDIKMPKLSGLELLKELVNLRSKENYFEIVLFTAYSEVDFAIEALRSGAFDYLLKPVSIADLEEIINKVEWKRKKDVRNNKQKKVYLLSNLLITEGIKFLLEKQQEFKFLEQTGGYQEWQLMLREKQPEFIIIGDWIKDISGIVLWKVIKLHYPRVKIILLSDQEVYLTAKQALSQGASSFLCLKYFQPDYIFQALKAADLQQKYIDPNLCQNCESQGTEAGLLLDCFTKRELKVFCSIAEGKTNREIASDLCLSNATVRNYVSNILKKLNLPNRVSVAAYAIKLRMQ